MAAGITTLRSTASQHAVGSLLLLTGDRIGPLFSSCGCLARVRYRSASAPRAVGVVTPIPYPSRSMTGRSPLISSQSRSPLEIWRNPPEEFCRQVKLVNGHAVRRERPGRAHQAAANRIAVIPDAAAEAT
jgi:hypothetical protein